MSTNPAVPRIKRRVLLASTAGAAAAAGGIGAWATQSANAQSDPQPASGGLTPLQGDVEGWASENGGVTGGSEEVTVSDADEFLAAIGEGGLIVRLSGSISISGMNNVASDTTVVGESGATITGGGLDISGESNVIIQNLAFDDWDDDAINVQEGSQNVWIDHNTFGVGYDGCVDVKRESDFVTISWNRIDGHDKNMLLGHSDDHTDDIGHLLVSYHHNFFNGTNQRNPRVRFGESVHVYNNYYLDIGSYCVATTMDAGVIFEGNFLENCNRSVDIGQADSGPGRVVSRDNHLVDTPEPVTEGSVEEVPYSYNLDPAEEIDSIVSEGAGAS